MSTHASGTFKVGSWDEKPVTELENGSRLTRASIAGDYAGELEGHATAETVMWYRRDGTAVYVSLERVVGNIAGRSGSFVMRGTGVYDGHEAKTEFSIVPGSGTGSLSGLSGHGSFIAPHGPEGRIELDFDLP